ncbi:MAG: choloylglycine hydrolase [Clostridia bacterium]|nr:choloylglycine hydrolase [Clostridia bacterium]
MCTAVSMNLGDHYFGRNLDLEVSYQEAVVIAPRRFPLSFKCMPTLHTHLAMIGTATVSSGYPLYYDATNETGLSVAALNFPGYAHYAPPSDAKDNIAPYELIPWILMQCSGVAQARTLLARINLAAIPFSDALPLSPLHFIISDKHESIVVEPMKDGLRIYDNPVHVLTNNPPFDYHLLNLSNYMALSSQAPENRLDPGLKLKPYSRGMGAMGLPGDLSSSSRFVRAAFMRANSLCGDSPEDGVTQFFHILGSVAHVRGSVMVNGKPEITVYSSCCNATRGIYHYTTYENSRITAIDMHKENLDGEKLCAYSLIREQQIFRQNG